MLGGKLRVVDNPFRGSPCGDQMAHNGRGSLVFMPLIHLLQDVGGPLVQAGATSGGDMIIQMVDQQGMPEVIDSTYAYTLLAQYARFQGLFQILDHGILIDRTRGGRFHGIECSKLERSS